MHKIWPTTSVNLLRSPRILLRRHALRFQEICFGVAAVTRETEWSETAVKEQTNYRASSKYFDLHHFWINMPQLFTFFRGSLCSSVKIRIRLRCGRPNYRCSFPVSSRLLCSNPHIPDLIQERPNILFKGHHRLFLLWGETTKGHTHFCGLRSGSHVENSQYLV